MRKGQQQVPVPGLGQESAQEFAYQIGTEVTIDADVHPMTGIITDVRQDDAGQKIIFVLPWGGKAMPYLAKDLTPVAGRTAGTIDKFLREKRGV
jgi:hypothetical protein